MKIFKSITIATLLFLHCHPQLFAMKIVQNYRLKSQAEQIKQKRSNFLNRQLAQFSKAELYFAKYHLNELTTIQSLIRTMQERIEKLLDLSFEKNKTRTL